MLPILYQSHDVILYSYPLFMGLGWGIAYQIYFTLLEPTYSKLKAQILFWGIFISAWLGAKVFFLLTYPGETIVQQLSFWTGGGFVFYGGLIAGLLFISVFKFIDKNLKLSVIWAMIPALAIGHGVGRIGCLLAGCCFGKPTDLFWGIYLHDHYRYPTQFLEAIALIMLGLYLMKARKSKFTLLTHYLIAYGVIRLSIEALRGDLVRGLWGPFTPSQWISFLLISSGLTLNIHRKFEHLRALN